MPKVLWKTAVGTHAASTGELALWMLGDSRSEACCTTIIYFCIYYVDISSCYQPPIARVELFARKILENNVMRPEELPLYFLHQEYVTSIPTRGPSTRDYALPHPCFVCR